jgi:uncharacterized protein (TIGR02145 family)/uncharacterized repeat protein (TIGR02543 family)
MPQDAGAQITALALPADGYVFTGWSGATTETANPITITMPGGDETLTANFRQHEGPPVASCALMVVAGDGGSVTGGGVFSQGTNTPITATPIGARCTFNGWIPADAVADPSAAATTVLITANRTVTANFSCEPDVRIVTRFTVVFNTNGGTPETISSVTVDSGSVFAAISPNAPTRTGYNFDGWFAGEVMYGAATVIVNNVTLTAGWMALSTYTVAYDGNDNDGGTAPIDSNSPYFSGSTVTILGAGDLSKIDNNFAGWNTRADGSGDSYAEGNMLVITGNITLYAQWIDDDIPTYTLTVNANPAGCAGALTGGGSYEAGIPANISVTAAENCTFEGWTGATGITDASLASTSVLMDMDKTVTANFTEIPPDPCDGLTTASPESACCIAQPAFPGCVTYTLMVSSNPTAGGSISRNPSQANYNAGTSVTVTATPDADYTFTGWSGASTSADTEITVIMDGNLELTANFARQIVPVCGDDGHGHFNNSIEYGSFIDGRDLRCYRTVQIGTQTWMAEDLKFTPGSFVCGDNGCLYGWAVAMNGASSSSSSPSGVQGICPDGWHIPSINEWDILVNYVDPNASGVSLGSSSSNIAATRLKSVTGWYSPEGSSYIPGTDDYGFSALPAFEIANATQGSWWSATLEEVNHALCGHMQSNNSAVYRPLLGDVGNVVRSHYSLRCVKDVYSETYTLTVNASPALCAVALTGGGSYEAGIPANISVTAVENCTFEGWTGATGITNASLASASVLMDANKTVTANFSVVTSFCYWPTHGCWPIRDPHLPNPDNPSMTNLQMCEAFGFLSQLSDCSDSPPCFGLATAEPGSACCIAQPTFNGCVTYTLTVNAGTGGTVTGGGTFNAGTNAPISATANAGYAFTGWTGVGVTNSSLANTTVSMTADRTVTANFSLISLPTGDTLVDDRDGQRYRTVTIGSQTWMAENLNWAGDGNNLGSCYNNSPDSCAKYGRLYDWSTAMELPPSCNSGSCANQVQSRHRGICPQGWHVPSDAEWEILVNSAGGSSVAGARLRSVTGWWDGVPGTDDFGFSALPGGGGWSGDFHHAGYYGFWWSATEYDAGYAWYRYLFYYFGDVYRNYFGFDKTGLFSLRCLAD